MTSGKRNGTGAMITSSEVNENIIYFLRGGAGGLDPPEFPCPSPLIAFNSIDHLLKRRSAVCFVPRSLSAIWIPRLREPIVINDNYWLGYIRFPKMEPFTENH